MIGDELHWFFKRALSPSVIFVPNGKKINHIFFWSGVHEKALLCHYFLHTISFHACWIPSASVISSCVLFFLWRRMQWLWLKIMRAQATHALWSCSKLPEHKRISLSKKRQMLPGGCRESDSSRYQKRWQTQQHMLVRLITSFRDRGMFFLSSEHWEKITREIHNEGTVFVCPSAPSKFEQSSRVFWRHFFSKAAARHPITSTLM